MNNKEYKNEILEVITPVRLQSYGGIKDLKNYIYNIQLSEAFYPAISILEITLRNRICNAIETSICKNWLLMELNSQNILFKGEYGKLLEASIKIKKSGKTITNDRLISEMTLGFWLHLFKKCYRTKLWDKKGFFEMVFPNYVSNGQLRNIQPLQQSLSDILVLRNRIFHHENIVKGNKTPEQQYQNILNILHLLSIDMEYILESISRFEKIVKQKP